MNFPKPVTTILCENNRREHLQGFPWIRGIIEKHRPIIVIELIGWNENNDEIKQYLEEIGYTIKTQTSKWDNYLGTPVYLFESKGDSEWKSSPLQGGADLTILQK